jgi:hypothetical protein
VLKCKVIQILKNFTLVTLKQPGVHGGTVGLGTALQARRMQIQLPMGSLRFSIENPSSHTVALGSTQPLTEISTRNISCGVKAASA